MVDQTIPCLLQDNTCLHGQDICRAHKRCMQGSQALQALLQRGGNATGCGETDMQTPKTPRRADAGNTPGKIALPCKWLPQELQKLYRFLKGHSMRGFHGCLSRIVYGACAQHAVLCSMGRLRAVTCALAAAAIAGQGLRMAPLLLMHLPHCMPGKGVVGVQFQNPGQQVSCSLQQCRVPVGLQRIPVGLQKEPSRLQSALQQGCSGQEALTGLRDQVGSLPNRTGSECRQDRNLLHARLGP